MQLCKTSRFFRRGLALSPCANRVFSVATGGWSRVGFPLCGGSFFLRVSGFGEFFSTTASNKPPSQQPTVGSGAVPVHLQPPRTHFHVLLAPDDVDTVIYHGGCYDGMGAAWAAWKRLGSKATYHAMQHSHKLPLVAGVLASTSSPPPFVQFFSSMRRPQSRSPGHCLSKKNDGAHKLPCQGYGST